MIYGLKEYVIKRGIMIAHIARVTGLTQPSVANKLNGRCSWKVDELPKLADALGMSYGQLLEFMGEGYRNEYR